MHCSARSTWAFGLDWSLRRTCDLPLGNGTKWESKIHSADHELKHVTSTQKTGPAAGASDSPNTPNHVFRVAVQLRRYRNTNNHGYLLGGLDREEGGGSGMRSGGGIGCGSWPGVAWHPGYQNRRRSIEHCGSAEQWPRCLEPVSLERPRLAGHVQWATSRLVY